MRKWKNFYNICFSTSGGVSSSSVLSRCPHAPWFQHLPLCSLAFHSVCRLILILPLCLQYLLLFVLHSASYTTHSSVMPSVLPSLLFSCTGSGLISSMSHSSWTFLAIAVLNTWKYTHHFVVLNAWKYTHHSCIYSGPCLWKLQCPHPCDALMKTLQ